MAFYNVLAIRLFKTSQCFILSRLVPLWKPPETFRVGPTHREHNEQHELYVSLCLQKKQQIYWMRVWHPDWNFQSRCIKITHIDWLTLMCEMALYWTFVPNSTVRRPRMKPGPLLNGHQRRRTQEWDESQRDVFVLLIDLDQSFTPKPPFCFAVYVACN